MEFAVEAQKLLEISLEGSVGEKKEQEEGFARIIRNIENAYNKELTRRHR